MYEIICLQVASGKWQVAKQLNLNRSQLYTEALRQFVDTHEPESIKAAFDEVYGSETATVDPVLMRMQLLSLPQDDEW